MNFTNIIIQSILSIASMPPYCYCILQTVYCYCIMLQYIATAYCYYILIQNIAIAYWQVLQDDDHSMLVTRCIRIRSSWHSLILYPSIEPSVCKEIYNTMGYVTVINTRWWRYLSTLDNYCFVEFCIFCLYLILFVWYVVSNHLRFSCSL